MADNDKRAEGKHEEGKHDTPPDAPPATLPGRLVRTPPGRPDHAVVTARASTLRDRGRSTWARERRTRSSRKRTPKSIARWLPKQ